MNRVKGFKLDIWLTNQFIKAAAVATLGHYAGWW